jgi:hypothetical protein
VSADILPLLVELTTAGQTYAQSYRGQTSEARVQRALAGKAGQAVTTEAELSGIFRSDAAFSTLATKRFLRLADTVEGSRTICPIAFVDGDLSRQHPYLRVQLIIVAHTSQPEDAAQCLLMRFETPEGEDPAGEGKHDFYHSQLCTELRIDRSAATVSIPECIKWGAVSCPAWPIDASTPLQLLACIVFALYGKVDGMRILRKVYGDHLDNLIEDMHFAFPAKTAALVRVPKRTAKRNARRGRR